MSNRFAVVTAFLLHLFVGATAFDFGVVGSTPHSSFSSDQLSLSSVGSNELQQSTRGRELAAGDYHDLEAVYKLATVHAFPNQTLSGDLSGNNWTVDVMSIRCQNFTVADLIFKYKKEDEQLLAVNLSSSEYGFNCFMDYNFHYRNNTGSGFVNGSTANGTFFLTAAFLSDNFTTDGPTGFSLGPCNATVEFATLNFDGNGIGADTDLQNAVEPQLLEVLALQSETFVCDALHTLNSTFNEFVQNASRFLAPSFNETLFEDSFAEDEVKSAEIFLTYTSNTTLHSFSNPKGTLAAVINFAIQEATSILGSNANETELTINDIMRSDVLDADGSLSLNASFLWEVFDGQFLEGDGYFAESYILPDTMKVFGLDGFTSFSAFEPVGDYTLRANFSLKSLSLSVALWYIIPGDWPEVLSLQIDMDQVNVTTDLLIAIDQDVLGEITMGSLFKSSNLLDCILSTVYDTQIANLAVAVGEIREPILGGLDFSPGSKLIATTFLSAAYDMYYDVVLAALPGFIQTTGRKLLTNLTSELLIDTSCPGPIKSSSPNGLIDLRDLFLSPGKAKSLNASGTSPYGDAIASIKDLIDSLVELDTSTGLPGINEEVIGPITEEQSGIGGALTNLFSLDETFDAEDSLSARIRIKISDFNVENIIMGDPLFLLEPKEPYMLNNTATLGANDSTPVQLRANIFFHWDGDDGLQINDNFTVGVDFYRANILAAIVLQLVEHKLLNFPLKDTFNLQCWLATMSPPTLDKRGVRIPGTDPTFGFHQLNLTADMVNFDLICSNCTEDKVFRSLHEILKSESGAEDAFRAVNKLVQFLLKAVNSGVLQLYLDRMIVDAQNKCPQSHSNERRLKGKYEPLQKAGNDNTIRFLAALLAATVALIVVAVLVSTVVRYSVRHRYKKWLQTLPPNQLLLIYKKQCLERRKKARMNEVARSMFQSKEIPASIRVIVPIVVFLNIGMFLSGHLNVAGSVEIRAKLAGQELRVEDFYKFSVILSARDLWNSGGKLPAAMIFLFSVIWPYTKQFVTLALWFLPPKTVPLSVRGFVFRMLDLLAKWSVIDIFFFIIALVAFRLSIASAKVSYLPPDMYSAELFLQPLWGLYANLIAQLISQVSAHFILNYHRRTLKVAKRDVERLEQEENEVNDELKPAIPMTSQELGNPEPAIPMTSQELGNREKLCNFGFTNSNQVDSNKLKIRGWVPLLLLVLSVAFFAAVIAGCILPSFSFATQGIVNIVLEAGHGFREIVNQRSIFSMAQVLVQQAQFLATPKARLGLGSLAAILVLNTLVVPLIHVVLVMAQFLLPLSPSAHANLEVAIEISQDWQYLDVYVISIIISLSQLGMFSESLVNPFCREINGFLTALAYYDVIDDRDDQCFRVQADINSGGYLLLAAAFAVTLLHTFVTKAFAQYRRNKVAATESNTQAVNAASDTDDADRVKQLIQPPPVVFTDTFRWFLYPEIAAPGASAAQVGETAEVQEKTIGDGKIEEGSIHKEKAIYDDDDDDTPPPASSPYEEGPLPAKNE